MCLLEHGSPLCTVLYLYQDVISALWKQFYSNLIIHEWKPTLQKDIWTPERKIRFLTLNWKVLGNLGGKLMGGQRVHAGLPGKIKDEGMQLCNSHRVKFRPGVGVKKLRHTDLCTPEGVQSA